MLLLLWVLPLSAESQDARTGIEELLPPSALAFDPGVPRPESVLGFPAGSRIAQQDRLVAWFEALAAASDRVSVRHLGDTHEGRRQITVVISSPRHQFDLEHQRHRHLDGERGAPLVTWHGFGVHGNESAGPQAAMLLAWYLAASRDAAIADMLDRVIVLIDPLQNPDGYVRFSRWLDLPGNPPALTLLKALPEPWPGGRTNHYLADLDSDWLLLQQPESRNRMKLLQAFRPHVMTDHHETGDPAGHCKVAECTSLLRPNPSRPDDPAHWLAERLGAQVQGAGSVHPPLLLAADTLPWAELSGVVGLRLTQIAAADAVSEVELIRGHLHAALGVLEGAVEFEQALKTFRDAHRDGTLAAPAGPAGWLIGGGPDTSRSTALLEVLAGQSLTVFGLLDAMDRDGRRYVPGAAWVVPALGPGAGMTRAILGETPGSVALAQAMGLSSLALDELPAGLDSSARVDRASGRRGSREAAAWILPWNDFYAPAVLNRLAGAGVGVRVVTAPLTLGSGDDRDEIGPGAIAIRRVDVPRLRIPAVTFLDRIIRSEVPLLGLDHLPDQSGQPSWLPLQPVRIGLLEGDGIDTASAGSLAFLLEHRLGFSVTAIRPLGLSADLLGSFTHLVMPAGDYQQIPSPVSGALGDWVRHGGVLITLAGATTWVLAESWPWSAPPGLQGLGVGGAQGALMVQSSRRDLRITGQHPLGFGLPAEIRLPPGDWPDLAVASEGAAEAVAHYVDGGTAIVELGVGRGVVLAFAGDPMRRGIWLTGERLISNAVSFGEILRRPAAEIPGAPAELLTLAGSR
ncbi:MAG: M14 family zinc carboxypeptidase [Pseudomonadales bacterium]